MMSSVTPESAGAPAAPRAGADLRAARERLGWPIEDVSGALRIRLPHLEALEEGRIDLLPGSAYAVGFLRTYAKTLGLDPDEIARRFKAEASEVNRRTELVFPAPMPQRGLPAGAVVLLGICLVIVAYAGWYRLSGEGRLPAETVTPVPQRLATLAEQAVPAPPVKMAPTPTATASLPTPSNGSTGAASAVAAGAPARSASGSQAMAASVPNATPGASAANAASGPQVAASAMPAPEAPAQPPPSISPTSAAAAPLPPMAMAAQPASAAAATPASRVVLEATADAWLEVRDRSGNVLLNRVLHKGDSWPVPTEPDLVLTTGNAGGTQIMVDGVAYPVPGGSGAVRRDLPLDADLIKAGKLAQAAPSGSLLSGGVTQAALSGPATR